MRLGERGRVWDLLPPLVAFALVNLALWLTAVTDGYDFLDPATWAHWDSFHYLDIADRGYTHFACVRVSWWDLGSLASGALQFLGFDVPLTDSCGNAGWFPGYPGLIRLVGVTGMSSAASGVLIAVLAQLLTLWVLWYWFLRNEDAGPALTALVAGAFFFGHIYYRAVFPMSVTTALLLAFVYLIGRDRWLLAGAAGAAAAVFYPTAFLIAPVTVVWLWWARPDLQLRARVVAASSAAGLTMTGYAAVIVFQWMQTGVWGAFFDIQSQFEYGIHLPTARLTDVVSPLFDRGVALTTVPNLHTTSVAVAVVAVTWQAVRSRATLTHAQKWVALAAVVFWLFPLTLGGRASLYRIESVLLPIVILLPRMPRWFQVSLVLALVLLSYPMALLFYRNVLV